MYTTFLSLLLILPILISSSPSCPCPINPTFPNKITPNITIPYTSPTPETLGVYTGNLIKTELAVFFTADVSAFSTSSSPIRTDCPFGFRAPTLEELSSFFELQISFVTSPDGMNVSPSLYYVSSFKAYPSDTSETSDNAYKFTAITLDNGALVLQNVSTYFSASMLRCKCVRDFTVQNVYINNFPYSDVVIGSVYPMTINEPNSIAYFWDFGNGTTTTTQTATLAPIDIGCLRVLVKVQSFSGDVFSQCLSFWAVEEFGSDGELLVNDNSDLRTKTLFESVYRSTEFHFTSVTAPLAPKTDGGVYILYTNLLHQMYVVELDSNFDQVTQINLDITGYPLDLQALPSGFIALVTDVTQNWLYLLCIDVGPDSWAPLWNQTLINNGANPTVAIDQLTFYDNGTYTNGPVTGSDPQFGMNLMFSPENGRLSYGRGSIGVIFTHYNNFGSPGEHTGDTFLIFDETGQNPTCSWSWGTSHSLFQQLLYSGQTFLTAALGDAYPQQIRFDVVPLNQTANTQSENLIPGVIPGLEGSSCGRLGGMMQLQENLFAATYARRACSTNGQTNNVNELGIVIFDGFLNLIKYKTLVSNSNVNVVKAAKYGDRIVIAFTIVQSSSGTFLPDYLGSVSQNTMYIMEVNNLGAIVTPPFQVDNFSISASDDWRVVKNGSIAWTYVNEDGALEVHWLAAKIDPRNATSYVDPPPEVSNTSGGIIAVAVIVPLLVVICLIVIVVVVIKKKHKEKF